MPKYTLRQWRNLKGYTQKDVADILGVTTQTISSWENNERFPPIDNVYQLCEIYNCEIENIFFDTK